MRRMLIPSIAVAIGCALASAAVQSQGRGGRGGNPAQRPPALLQNYVDFSVTAPPAALELDGRGFGGEPNGENTTSCAEENLLGYPGTRYFGQSICVHEFSHGIMRGAIYTVDPDYRKAVEDAYAAAKNQGLSSAQGYPGNNFNEYWATGIEAYVFGSGRDRDRLIAADPRLYELVRQVIPPSRMPGNVYVGRTRQ
jgi:hypothetical protein